MAPVALKQMMPSKSERMLIVGTTGCGKTTLARELLAASKYSTVLVIDPKCTYGGKEGEDGYTMVRRPQDLRKLRHSETRIQFRPNPEYQGVEDFDAVYWWAYRRQDIMVYTDETFLTMNRSYAPDGQRACVTCGRELGVGMIFATQRPRGVDLRILTEAEVLAMFELRHREDRKRMAELMGEEVMNPLPRHAYWFWRTGMKAPIAAKLRLGGKPDV